MIATPRTILLLAALAGAPLAAACGAGPTTGPSTPPAGGGLASASSTPAPPPLDTAPLAATAPSAAPSAAPVAEAVQHDPAQLDPSLATAKAPELFRARFTTTRGDFVIEVHRAWAPNGADRFYNLVKMGFFDDTRVFRVIEGFMAQFGINGEPRVAAKWRSADIQDDPVVQSNKRGYVTFAQSSAPNTRSTQVFVNYADNSRLDASRFAPFGQVVQGMSVVDALYHGYGEGAPNGAGPDQMRVQESGNRYLDEEFPRLDRILRTQVQ